MKINNIFYLILLWVFLMPQAQAEWVDISPSVEITQTQQALDRVKRVLFSYVSITNISSETVDPVRLVITNPSIPVLNADGVTDNGNSYLQVTGGLAAGESTKVRVDFQLKRAKLLFGTLLEEDKTMITVDLSDTGISIELDKGEYQLITPSTNKRITGVVQDIEDDIKENHIIAIVNRYNEPIMIHLSDKEETDVSLNIKNTAEALVLMRPYFFSLEFKDRNELSNRIRNHNEFQALVDEMKKQIESGNTCPLNPDCSYKAALIAERIAIGTDLTGLIK